MVSNVNVTGAVAGTTFTLTAAGTTGVTLSATIGGATVSQSVTLSAMTTTGTSSQTLDFNTLGVKLTLSGFDAAGTVANLITDLTVGGATTTIITAAGSSSASFQVGANANQTVSVAIDSSLIERQQRRPTAFGAGGGFANLAAAVATFAALLDHRQRPGPDPVARRRDLGRLGQPLGPRRGPEPARAHDREPGDLVGEPGGLREPDPRRGHGAGDGGVHAQQHPLAGWHLDPGPGEPAPAGRPLALAVRALGWPPFAAATSVLDEAACPTCGARRFVASEPGPADGGCVGAQVARRMSRNCPRSALEILNLAK